MVFTTALNLIRSKGPDEFWRKRKIFKLASVSFIHKMYKIVIECFMI